jgi:VWFA-related protein
MLRFVRKGLALAALTVALGGAVAVAQNPPPAQPIFRGGTNVVRVDMFATRDGRLVDDLEVSEVEILEDGVKQTIDLFERVVVRPPVAQELRAEPNSATESRQMAADARARIFVIFLDTYHATFGSAARMRTPLLQFIDRVVGQDDLIGLMTPEMAATDVTLGRRTTVISRLLDENTWGRRARITDNDPIEDMYEACFTLDDPKIAPEMKARRRERLTLDALDDLVTHLGGLRDERKAVLAVSEGWLQYQPNAALARMLEQDRNRIPNPPGVVDRGVSRADSRTNGGVDRDRCNADRLTLANTDNRDRLLRTAERANRVNVTFYPVGAQGLAVFDSDIGPEPPPPLTQDSANLRNRQNGLRLLADVTDGVAIVNTNNVAPLLRRVVDDLSAYYLMTYSSTNSKLDGRFRSISVRVSRPGVQTRARRGYRALTAGEIPTTVTDTGAGAAPAMPPSQSAVLAALNAMAFNPRAELRLRASAFAASGQGAFWLVGTLDDAARRTLEWSAGGTADVSVRGGDGQVVLSKAVALGPADGGFAVQVPELGALPPGDYAIRVRARGAAGAILEETARVSVPAQAPALGEPIVWRRRPSTAAQYFRTADPRASRPDRLRFELAATGAGEPVATLLDRTGKPIAVPLQVAARDEGGVRWITVETAIAPLAPGDYAVEVKLGDATRTTAFRVVP